MYSQKRAIVLLKSMRRPEIFEAVWGVRSLSCVFVWCAPGYTSSRTVPPCGWSSANEKKPLFFMSCP